MATVRIGGRTYDVTVRGDVVVVDGVEYPVTVRDDGAYVTVTASGVAYRVQLPPEGERSSGMVVEVDHRPMSIEYEGTLGGRSAAERATPAASRQGAPRAAASGAVTAQIAGRIISVRVKPGDAVKAGDVLLLLEAMKMENEIKSPNDGVVSEVLVKDGDRVAEGDALVVVTPE